MLGSYREAKVPILQERNVKPSRGSAQTSMQSHANRILSEAEGVPPEDRDEMKCASGRRGGMVNTGSEPLDDAFLEIPTLLEVPVLDQSSEGWILLKLQQEARSATESHDRRQSRLNRLVSARS
jgi:hypothetical protein